MHNKWSRHTIYRELINNRCQKNLWWERKIFSYLTRRYSGNKLELKVMKSLVGFYQGTEFNDNYFTRESDYYDLLEDAENDLAKGTWEQRSDV